jgi:DNA-3-methyladenine glycosylase
MARKSLILPDLTAGTEAVAAGLLGARLIHETADGHCAGRIVETEAYLSEGDPASHSRMGPTARNASMFLGPGHAYVYRIYGMHLCFNVVTGAEGVGEAVLVRAVEPLEGLEEMVSRRGTSDVGNLCSGPGKLAQAFGIEPEHDGQALAAGRLRLELGAPVPTAEVERSPRIGISQGQNLDLRFTITGCRWKSR